MFEEKPILIQNAVNYHPFGSTKFNKMNKANHKAAVRDPVRTVNIQAPSFPKRITLELSATCNLNCTMCPRKFMSKGHGFMEMPLFETIIAQLQGRSIDAVVPFFRGESLLNPHFLKMLRRIRDSVPAVIQLATNALLMDDRMIRNLIAINIEFISFSLDAINSDTYKMIRCGSDFHRVMNNVHAFLEARDNAKGCTTIVQVSATEMGQNRNELPEFIDYWQSRADRVRIYPRHSEDGHFGKLSDQTASRSNRIRQPCRKPFTDLVIYHNGQVALCNHDWDRSDNAIIGSIPRNSLEEIWNGGTYRHIRQLHRNRLWSDIGLCRDCDHWAGLQEPVSAVGTLIT